MFYLKTNAGFRLNKIAYCPLPIAYCPLPIAYCLLPIAYCPLSAPSYKNPNKPLPARFFAEMLWNVTNNLYLCIPNSYVNPPYADLIPLEVNRFSLTLTDEAFTQFAYCCGAPAAWL